MGDKVNEGSEVKSSREGCSLVNMSLRVESKMKILYTGFCLKVSNNVAQQHRVQVLVGPLRRRFDINNLC